MKVFYSLILGALLACCMGCAPKSLVAELRNARVTDAVFDEVEVEFVLTNHSLEPIKLAERWNSWGSRQWWFSVVDAKGNKYVLNNPQTNWFANYLSLLVIESGKSHVLRCRLVPPIAGPTKTPENGVALFYLEKSGPNWEFPLEVTGHFAAVINAEHQAQSNWKGEIETSKIIVTRKSSDSPR
jgi:hypothetical protein